MILCPRAGICDEWRGVLKRLVPRHYRCLGIPNANHTLTVIPLMGIVPALN